jgi:membrane-bound inhibitor of C-type lysozyme
MKNTTIVISVLALGLLSACQTGGSASAQVNSETIRYACKGSSVQDFRIVFSGDKAQTAVMSSSQRKQAVVLTLTETASGAKYLGSDNVEFWSKGDQAMIEWPRGMRGECTQIK